MVASITVGNLEDGLMRRLRIRAAANGRSMGQEVLEILRTVLAEDNSPPENLATAIHSRFKPLGDVELDLSPRTPMREPPAFD